MRSILTIIVLCFAVNFSFAQKVKIKKDIVYVDGKKYVKAERESGNMSIYSLNEDEEELVFIKLYDPTPNNKTRNDSYYIVRFIEANVEVEISGKSRKGIIKMLYKGKVIKDGEIDQKRLKSFVSKYGSDESANKIYI